MKFCKENDRPNPGFVILDSPLTNLRENQQDVASEEVTGETQTAFFEHLADTPKDEQVNILENKIPPASVQERINFIELRKAGEGRRGFYPTVTKRSLKESEVPLALT